MLPYVYMYIHIIRCHLNSKNSQLYILYNYKMWTALVLNREKGTSSQIIKRDFDCEMLIRFSFKYYLHKYVYTKYHHDKSFSIFWILEPEEYETTESGDSIFYNGIQLHTQYTHLHIYLHNIVQIWRLCLCVELICILYFCFVVIILYTKRQEELMLYYLLYTTVRNFSSSCLFVCVCVYHT